MQRCNVRNENTAIIRTLIWSSSVAATAVASNKLNNSTIRVDVLCLQTFMVRLDRALSTLVLL